jgi:hypothetical protein
MFRKLVSSIVVFALATIGLTQAGPAQAWPDYSSDVNVSEALENRWDPFPIGKSVNSEMVYVYNGYKDSDQSRFLKTFTVSSTGTIHGPFLIESNTNNKNYWIADEASSWIDSNGVINLIYGASVRGESSSQSTLNHITSRDGQVWSTPTVLETTSEPAGSACLENQMMSSCGVGQYSVATNSLGAVGLAYVIVSPDKTNKVHYRTKPFGKSWSAGTVLNTSDKNLFGLIIKPTTKGWLAAWTSIGQDNLRSLMSSFSTGDKGSSFTAPQLRATGSCLYSERIHQTALNKFAVIYVSGGCTEGDPTKLSNQVFDASTSRFASAQVLYTFEGGNGRVHQTKFVGGQSAIGFSDYALRNQNYEETAKYILFRNGVGSLQNVNVDSSQGEFGNQNVVGMHLDVLGHLSVVWQSSRGLAPSLTVSSFFRGNRSDTDVTFPGMSFSTSGNQASFSPDGDVYLLNSMYGSTTIKTRVRIRSDAPDLMSDVKILGTAKANATISAKLPLVTPNLIGQRWNFSYQWYSCQYRVTEVLSIATENCSAISGATASSYKAKSADKGKFLQVKLSVKSDNATQVQFSASTLAVK